MLASSLAGMAGAPVWLANGVGAASMGVSVSGNAYAQALNEGYSKQQARAYGDLVGASEGVLQYLIGGITKLGGVEALKGLSADIGSVAASDVQEQLTKLSGIIVKSINGTELTESQVDILESLAKDERVVAAMKDTFESQESTAYQLRQKVADFEEMVA